MIKDILHKLGRRRLFLILAAAGLGLLLIIIGTASGRNVEKSETKQEENVSDESYISSVENKICNVIAKITGDTSPAVLITVKGGTERIYIKNGEGYVTVRTENGYAPVLSQSVYPEITGISVVCRGGDSAEVKKKLIDVISTATGVSSNRICVVGTK